MRNYSIFVLGLMFALAGVAGAQTETKGTRTEIDSATGQRRTVIVEEVRTERDVTPRNNMIVVNPLKMFLFYNISYYRKISNTVVVGGGLQMPSLSFLGGFGANAELRLHPSGRAMRGFYVAPNISYSTLKFTGYADIVDPGNTSVGDFTIGILLGWQWFPGDDFAMGLGLGIDYNILTGSDNGNHFGSYTGTTPALRFDIGYAWE